MSIRQLQFVRFVTVFIPLWRRWSAPHPGDHGFVDMLSGGAASPDGSGAWGPRTNSLEPQMKGPTHRLLASIGTALLVAVPLGAQQPETEPSPGPGTLLLNAEAIPYEEIAPGVERAILFGDPLAEGEPFVFRLRITGSFEMEPHTHPVPEHMTVLSGRLFVGIGEVMDRSAAVGYGPGSFVWVDADVPAFMWAEGETVVQIHGIGPLRTVPVS
jgi:mannose-6-phosphate isomerase-like protein (cupin superfamily)